MKRNRAAVVTTVSTVMLGAGWTAGMLATAVNAQNKPAALVSQTASSAVATTAPSSTAASASPSTTSSPSASASAPAPVSGTFDGAAVNTQYGTYQAALTVTAGKITNISMLQSGDKDGTSRQISGFALPQLISAVLKQQKADVGYVSGASFTSQGFEASVKDAMTQAGLA